MDIFFQDPSETPLPPNEVRIRELQAEAWPDGRRVHVYIEVDPFQKRPSADLIILDSSGDEIAHSAIIESMVRKMELTLHLRPAPEPGEFILAATLFYSDPIPEPKEGETEPPKLPEQQVIDTRSIKFTIEKP